ncbi:MAG: hypothetical protein JNL01_04550 [Bdellovibrionales bacterium]|nr:hypothetical protein [Bdellovibrionales bacterium]
MQARRRGQTIICFLILFTGSLTRTSWAAATSADPSASVKIPEPPSPTFPKLPTSRTSASSSDVVIRAVRADGSVESLKWKTKVEPFPDQKAGVRLQVSLPTPLPDLNPSPPATIDPKTGMLSLTLFKTDANFLGQRDSFLMSLEPSEPWVLTDPSCGKLGLVFHMAADPSANPVYLKIECSEADASKKRFRVKISYPPRAFRFASTFSASIQDTDAEKAATAEFTVSVPDPKGLHPTKNTLLASFEIKDAKIEANRAQFEVSIGADSSKRWSFDAGLAVSTMMYDEPSFGSGLSITQLGITGKFGAIYQIQPDRYSLVLNAFSTLIPIPISKNPSTITGSLFSGANLRVGYQLPESVKVAQARVSVFAGWYAWSTLAQDSYGISLLTGPQFFGVLRFPSVENKPNPYAYLKFSPIAESISNFKLSNREIALGGGYPVRIPKLFKEKDLIATLDIAHIFAEDKTATSRFSLLTISAGLSFPFNL